MAKRELRRLRKVKKKVYFVQGAATHFKSLCLICSSTLDWQEANEAGALRLAKNKLEKQLEDLTWRLHLEKRLRVLFSILDRQ